MECKIRSEFEALLQGTELLENIEILLEIISSSGLRWDVELGKTISYPFRTKETQEPFVDIADVQPLKHYLYVCQLLLPVQFDTYLIVSFSFY